MPIFSRKREQEVQNFICKVVNNPRAPEESIIGFRWEREMQFVRAEARHLNPMGAGFYQLGLQLISLVSPGEHPVLESFTF